MLRLASDADVQGDIIRGLLRRAPEISLLRSRDVLRDATLDPDILAWTAAENRILITNDRNTMVGFAFQRVAAGKPMPGVIATTKAQPIGRSIEDILLIAKCFSEDEIRNQVIFLPLRSR